MHTILCTDVCLCYLKQRCKSYKLFNKHNKSVELSDITSAENLENSQNRCVKGLGSVCKMYSSPKLYYPCMQQTTNTSDLSPQKLQKMKAEFFPLVSNMNIQNWQLRLLDVIGEGYNIIQITSHLCIQLQMVNCVNNNYVNR